jgi:hypothetical protein
LVLILGSLAFFGGESFGIERPFLLWNKADIAEIRERIETQPWARAAYDKLRNEPERHEEQFARLLEYALTQGEKLAEREKQELMRMVRSPIPRGGAQYINLIRYDMLYDLLTADEHAKIKKCFEIYIDNAIFNQAVFNPEIFNDEANYSRYDARKYTRTNWLPNIIWPRKISANLMAAVLADETLIRKVWGAYGSWKWYFDEYLCDTGFYSEEFGKMGATPGAMLIYCRAAERLGLGELGFGYRGKGGATMKGHIESLIHLGYPRVDIGSDLPHYPMLTIGDLRQSGSSQSWNLPSPAFQHSIVMGYTPDGAGGNDFWKAHGAWGGVIRGKHKQWDGYGGFTPKMQIPYWFEIGHKRWPEVGFDYFLAQMRRPGQDNYYQSLYFGLDPIDPDKVEAPAAPSAVWPERGLVMLRADESHEYWESEGLAVGMRLATNYAHNVIDCFALAGFYAFGRPIYINRQVTPGYASDWSRSIQSHCGLVVDGGEPKFTNETTIRKGLTTPVKFVAARSGQVYPGVDLTRALMLTREYLLDITRAVSSEEKHYCWLIHALGQTEATSGQWKEAEFCQDLEPLKNVRRFDAGGDGWSVKVFQRCAFENSSKARLPRQWYERQIGVRLNMLGNEGTRAYTAQTPLIMRKWRDKDGKQKYEEMPSEVGGITIVSERKAKGTVFAALHEPFQGGAERINEFRRIQQNDDAIAVAVGGEDGVGIDDRLMLGLGNGYKKAITLGDGRESFTFSDWAYVRIGEDKVEVCGDLRAMKVAVEGTPKLVINGKEEDASVSGGYLSYK